MFFVGVYEWSFDVESLKYPWVSSLFWFKVLSFCDFFKLGYFGLPDNLFGIVFQ